MPIQMVLWMKSHDWNLWLKALLLFRMPVITFSNNVSMKTDCHELDINKNNFARLKYCWQSATHFDHFFKQMSFRKLLTTTHISTWTEFIRKIIRFLYNFTFFRIVLRKCPLSKLLSKEMIYKVLRKAKKRISYFSPKLCFLWKSVF